MEHSKWSPAAVDLNSQQKSLGMLVVGLLSSVYRLSLQGGLLRGLPHFTSVMRPSSSIQED